MMKKPNPQIQHIMENILILLNEEKYSNKISGKWCFWKKQAHFVCFGIKNRTIKTDFCCEQELCHAATIPSKELQVAKIFYQCMTMKKSTAPAICCSLKYIPLFSKAAIRAAIWWFVLSATALY